MTAFFNTNRARKSIRRQARYKPMLSYCGNNKNNSCTDIILTKEQQDALTLGFTGYALKYGNIMLIGDIEYMLPEYKYDIYPDVHNLVRNDIFVGITADKIILMYSSKLKKFVYLAITNNYEIGILFKSDNYHDLPNVENLDIDNLNPLIEIKDNANRLMFSVFYNSEILDLTSNPYLNYRINEIFKK